MYERIKGVLDRFFAFIGIVVMSPILLLSALLTRADGHGKAIFRQERVGKGGKIFLIYKFRTMKSTDVAFDTDHAVIEDDNPSVTPVGRVLRKLKIDEVPQLFNILKGDMSFIGPRPLMPVYLEEYEEWEKHKFDVKPGLSGLAQVSGNGYLEKQGRSYYDVLYAENVSFGLDVKLFFKTFLVILKGEEYCLKNVSEEQIEEMKRKYSLDGNEKKDE